MVRLRVEIWATAMRRLPSASAGRLVVGGHRHATAPSTSDGDSSAPFCSSVVEMVERAARLLGRDGLPLTVIWLPLERMSTPSFCSMRARFSSNWP
jgi:hypothetical protein